MRRAVFLYDKIDRSFSFRCHNYAMKYEEPNSLVKSISHPVISVIFHVAVC